MGTFVVVLDDDTVPWPDWIAECVEFIKSGGPKIVGCSGIDGFGRRNKSASERFLLGIFGSKHAEKGWYSEVVLIR